MTWVAKLKLLWRAFHCHHCSTQRSNLMLNQPTMEAVELAKLQANSKLLRGNTAVSFGHYNGLVMVYFDSFTLNIAMTEQHVEWFCENLRAQQEQLKNEASEG